MPSAVAYVKITFCVLAWLKVTTNGTGMPAVPVTLPIFMVGLMVAVPVMVPAVAFTSEESAIVK